MTESTYGLAPEPDDAPAPQPGAEATSADATATSPTPAPAPTALKPMPVAAKLLMVLLTLGLLAAVGGGAYLLKLLKPSFATEATLHIAPADDPLAPHIEAINQLPEARATESVSFTLTLTPDDTAHAIRLRSLTGPAPVGSITETTAMSSVNSIAETYAAEIAKADRAACDDEMADIDAQMALTDARIDALTTEIASLTDCTTDRQTQTA